jgi:hypothetical protein
MITLPPQPRVMTLGLEMGEKRRKVQSDLDWTRVSRQSATYVDNKTRYGSALTGRGERDWAASPKGALLHLHPLTVASCRLILSDNLQAHLRVVARLVDEATKVSFRDAGLSAAFSERQMGLDDPAARFAKHRHRCDGLLEGRLPDGCRHMGLLPRNGQIADEASGAGNRCVDCLLGGEQVVCDIPGNINLVRHDVISVMRLQADETTRL